LTQEKNDAGQQDDNNVGTAMEEAEDGEDVGTAAEESGDGEEQDTIAKEIKGNKSRGATMRKSTRKRGAPKRY